MAIEIHRAWPLARMRGEELTALRRAYRDAEEGEPPIVILEGPAGAGTDALVGAWAAELGGRVVLSIGPGSNVVERLLDAALGALSPVRRSRHPANTLARRSQGQVLDLMAASERRLRLREETAHLLRELDAVVVIHDAQRLERSAIDLIVHLVERRAGFFVAIAGAPVPSRLAQGARIITLRPLDRDGVRALLTTSEIVDAVLERTSGLPELVMQLVRGEPVPETSARPEPSPLETLRALVAAGRHEHAARFAIETAEQLAAAHAEIDAADLLLEASARLEHTPPALLRRLAEILWIAGDHTNAVASAERLVADDPSDGSLVLLGRLLSLQGRHAGAIEVLARARGHEADVALADAHYGVGSFDEARTLARRAAGSADPSVALDAENTIAKVEIARGENEHAQRRLASALARALSAGLPRHACQALNNLGIIALGRGDLGPAIRSFERMIELGAEHGVVFYRGVAHKNLAVALQLEGRYEEAIDHAERALSMLAGIGDKSLIARVAFNTADLHVALGDPYRALALIAYGREQAGELSDAVEREGLRVEGAARAELGNLREARACYERAITLGDESASARLELALLAVDADEIARARELLAQVGEPADRRARARAALVRVRIAPPDERVPLARLAVDQADATGDPLLGQAPRIELARALHAAGLTERALEEIGALRERETRLLERVPARLHAVFSERPLARRIAGLTRSLSAQPVDGASLGAMAYERVRRGDGSLYTMRKRIERECIERALLESDGNISRAAELLGMKRPRLSKLVGALGLKATGSKK